MSPTRWTAGDRLAIVWPGGAALVDAAVGHAAAEQIWTRLHQESTLGAFLQALAAGSDSGFLDLPSFAIVVSAGDRWHLAVRGTVAADVWAGGAVEALSGDGITTWAERVLAAPDGVRLGMAPEAVPAGPILDGVVPAGSLTVGQFASATPLDIDPELACEEKFSQVRTPETPVPVEHVETEPPEPEPQQDAQDSSANIGTVPAPDNSDEPPAEEDPPQPPATVPEAQETLAEEAIPQEPNKYASLWDQSVAVDVEAAAIRPGADEGEGASPMAPVTAAAPDNSAEQLFGETVVDDGAVEVRMPAPASDAPQVLARFCDQHHANPPERASCFVCGGEVSGDAGPALRPQLGWLRVEGGETIPLRGPIIAGRNPKSNVLKLDEAPRLVALPHPHVSGTHLAIVIEGWRILARDLRSSNGTYLRRHGKPPIKLPESSVPLVPGDLIDLGKGLFLHLEGTP